MVLLIVNEVCKKWSKHSSESRRNGREVVRGRAGAFILKLLHVQNISDWYSVESIKLMMSIFYLSVKCNTEFIVV